MKTHFQPTLFLFALFLYLSSVSSHLFAQNTSDSNKERGDYWMDQIRQENFNFHTFVKEFQQYWNGRIPDKGSGIKQVHRWIEYNKYYANSDGSMRSPEVDHEIAKAFNQQNASQTIAGNWEFIGPDYTVGGRTTAIAFSPHNSQQVYVGTPTGGLWVSQNSGMNFQHLNTDNLASFGVSAIAVHPTNPNIIFIGTGDRDNGDSRGIGIYKSSDAGNTWQAKPISNLHDKIIHKIYFHPQYPNDTMTIIGNYGVYQSFDGGNTWSQTYAIYTIDAEQKPGEPNTLYIAGNSDIYKSVNFGRSWSKILTIDSANRIALAVCTSAPGRIAALSVKDSKFYRLYTSTNSGQSFSLVPSTGMQGQGQGWFNLDIIIDPLNAEIMYAGMVNFYKSTNGGVTWINQEAVYADDQHTFEFHPVTHRLFIGNDSGIWKTDDGVNYSRIGTGFAISRSYRLDVAAQNPNHWIIGSQDASTFVTNGGPYYNSIGADGITCKFDYTNSNYVYGSSQYGFIARSTTGGLSNYSFTGIAGNNINGINQTGNFQTAFVLDYTNPNIMFAGMKDLWRSTNVKTSNPANVSWQNISNGAFGPIATIEFVEQSKANQNIVYVFTDDSRIFRTDNALNTPSTWTQLDNPTFSGGVRFTTHPTNAEIVYMSCGSKVYRSSNRGNTWSVIPGNFPQIRTLSIEYMNGSNEGLYVGTVQGVYYRDNNLSNWTFFKTGLPLTHVKDLVINYSTNPPQLFAAAFGRGIWKTQVDTAYRPDLIAASGTATINGVNVNSITSVYNADQMVTVSGCSSGYYLSADQTITNTDYLVGTTTQPTLAPGILTQSQIGPIDVAEANPDIPPGSYTFGFLVDYNNLFAESNETNNQWVASGSVTIPANPASPENVQATDGTYNDKIVISWQNNTGEPLYFAVFRSTSSFGFTSTQISPSTWSSATTYEDFTAQSGKDYFYFVKASRYPSGIRASALSTGNLGWRKLETPSNIEATDGLYSDKVTISWSPVEGASYYKIFSSLDNVIITCISGPNWLPYFGDYYFNDLNAETGTTYYYYVQAAVSVSGSRASQLSDYNTGWRAFTNAPAANASDGTFTNKVTITWEPVSGATHYAVYRKISPFQWNPPMLSGWQTETSFDDYTANTGAVYYYTVKAANNPSGTNTTGLGIADEGFRNFIPPAWVNATDGTSDSYCQVTWAMVSGAPWAKIYRGTTSIGTNAQEVSNWTTQSYFNDVTGVPGTSYFYFVKVAGDTTKTISDFAVPNRGYRTIPAPAVAATIGVHPAKVAITWQPAPGASYYMVQRSTLANPAQLTDLTQWSNTLNNQWEDLTAVPGVYYNYYVTGSMSSTGLRAGLSGSATGLAASCGNLTDSPQHRSVFFHGSTLELTQRVINTGPHPWLVPGKIALALESAPADGTPETIFAVVSVPALAVNDYYDISLVVDLDTVSGFNFTYGTWFVSCLTSYENACDSNPFDDYVIWEDLPFEYTDALHGIYTVGSNNADFINPSEAFAALISRGMSDPVKFYLQPETFYGSFLIPAITGIANKSVTIETDPQYPVMANIVGIPNPDNNYTIKFQNASNIIFRNLRLGTQGFSNYSSTYGRIIDIGQNCNNISFIENHIAGSTDISFLSGNSAAIYAGNSNSSNILIQNNQITHGEYSIQLSGENMSTTLSNLTLTGNECIGFFATGIYLSYVSNSTLTDNIIENSTSYSPSYLTGIHLFTIPSSITCTRNKIRLTSNGFAMNGLLLNNINLSGSGNSLVANNFITLNTSQSACYGLYAGDCSSVKIYHNSINLFGTTGAFNTGVNLYNILAPTSTNEFRNNIVYNQLGGYALCLGQAPGSSCFLASANYNNYATTGFSLLLNNSVPISSISAWTAATGFDRYSLSENPGFVSNTDLHCNTEAMDNKCLPLAEVTTDIDGEVRSLTNPDIGADEFTYAPPVRILTITVFLEGLYSGLNSMNPAMATSAPRYGPDIADAVSIQIRDGDNYNQILHTFTNVMLSTSGTCSVTIPVSVTGFHYITLKHRNSIAITTSGQLNLSQTAISLNFSNPARVFGSNLKQMPTGQWVVYGGDVNQDNVVNANDINSIYSNASTFTRGYVSRDVNGDGVVDAADLIITDNNAARFVSVMNP